MSCLNNDDESTQLKIAETLRPQKAKPNLKKTAGLGEKRPREVATPESKVYELRIALYGTKVWRSFQVLSNTSFAKLHRVIQRVMGWRNCHMHIFHVAMGEGEEFTKQGVRWENPCLDIGDDSYDFDNMMLDERTRELGTYLHKKGDSFGYSYDLGDSWEHRVVLKKILDPEQDAAYPRCVAGKLACPPEDCGGEGGYADLVNALANPNDTRHEELREWAGDDYDPKHFDVKEVNRALVGM